MHEVRIRLHGIGRDMDFRKAQPLRLAPEGASRGADAPV